MTTKNMVVYLIFQLIVACRQNGWNLLLKKAGLKRHLSRLFSFIFPWFGMENRGIEYGMGSVWVGYVKTPLTNGIIYLKREQCNQGFPTTLRGIESYPVMIKGHMVS